MSANGGWTKASDPSSGRVYYYHSVTKETRWEAPPDFVDTPSAAAGDWDERQDPNSGKTYYFNKKTKETSWAPPPGYYSQPLKDSKPTPPASTDPARWQSKLDKVTNREYFYNKATMETTWTKPPCLIEAVSPPWTPPEAPQMVSMAETRQSVAMTKDAAAAAARASLKTEEAEVDIAQLCEQYASMDFEQFAEQHFQLYRKGMFKAKSSVEKVTHWKNDLIKTALMNFKDNELAAEAVQTFRNVTGYMGDRGSTKAGVDHCTKILNNMLQSPEELRDECYCQIVKQTKGNPSEESTVRGWQLMAICLATFPPSEALTPHLGWYCVQNLKSEYADVRPYAELCLRRVPTICALGTRRELPTIVEVESTTGLSRAMVRVFFLDGKYVTLPVDAWTTSVTFGKQIAAALGITPAGAVPFNIFEVSSMDEERVLDDGERILDLVAYWYRITSEARAKTKNVHDVEELQFVYKVRHFFEVPDEDRAAIELMYVQATHDVVDARYPCTTQDAVTLAALQLQEEYGDMPTIEEEGEPCTYLEGAMGKFLSDKILGSEDEEEALKAQLLKLYGKLSGYSQAESRLSYLDYVKSWKIYGSSYFFAEPKQNRDFPSEVILAISAKGILVVDPQTKDYLQEYPYSQVVTWGHSSNSFVVVTGTAVKQVKAYFKTEQGKEMNIMVRAYVEALMG